MLYFVIYLVNYNWNFELLWGQNCQFVCLILQNPQFGGTLKLDKWSFSKPPKPFPIFLKLPNKGLPLHKPFLPFPSPPKHNLQTKPYSFPRSSSISCNLTILHLIYSPNYKIYKCSLYVPKPPKPKHIDNNNNLKKWSNSM